MEVAAETLVESKFSKHIDGDEIVRIVSDLVRQNTVNPPGNEHLCTPIVRAKMEALGMRVTTYEKVAGRTNVVGVFGSGSPSIGFVSHMDVVPPGDPELWDTDPFEPVIKDGKIYGRGTLDDKGSFACAYSACKAFLAEHPGFSGTLCLVAAADEELGSELGIGYLLREEGLRFDVAIIPDGGKMNLAVYGEKGVLWVEISSAGIQGHGSMPELGRNAIMPLADLVVALESLDFGKDWSPEFDGWTMNVASFHGGSSTNIIPASATIAIDFRLPEGISRERVLAAIDEKIAVVKRRSPAAEFTVRVTHETQPHLVPRTSHIIQCFDRAARRLGIDMGYETMGGNTVAKDLFFAGITAVVHYPGDDKLAHVPNEYCVIDEMVLGSVLYAETLEEYFFPVIQKSS